MRTTTCATRSTKPSSTACSRRATWWDVELLNRARHAHDFADIRAELAVLPDFPIGTEQWVRALDVYEKLSGRGGRAVLHCDEDFEHIAEVTGQATRRRASQGSLRWSVV